MKLKAIILVSVVLFCSSGVWAETLYVRSVKAQLKSLPLFSSESVSVLTQGESVNVVGRKGSWVEVTAGSHTGWISAFFTNPQPVLKFRPVLPPQESNIDLSGKGRRRASSYTTSAAARGLYDERARSGDRRYKPDFDSLAVMESYSFSEEEVLKFLKQEGLK